MKEFSFIETLQKRMGTSAVPLGIGDDAALADDVLIAKDIMVEDVHFTRHAPLENIIYRLFTANVSDIAAMGGTARNVLLGVASPPGRVEETALCDAIEAACKDYGVNLIGGDTTASKHDLFLSLTVTGTPGPNLLTRSAARPGDVVFLSRPCGFCQYHLERELEGMGFYAHYRMRAETALGSLLSASGLVSCAIDISDGLGRDLSHIADASKVAIHLDQKSIPIAHLPVTNRLKYALASGEEFALAFTVPEEHADQLTNDIKARMNRPLYPVGKVTEGSGVFIDERNISNFGHEHQL